MDHEPDDTELERELRRIAARLEPVPPALLQAAFDAFAWRTVDTELAELVFDSLLDQDEDALVRSAGEERLLSFETGDLIIEVEVTGTGSSRRLMGQFVPPRQASIDIRHVGGDTTSVDTDELGRFTVPAVPAGLISIRYGTAGEAGEAGASGAHTVVTDWVSI
ncbi:MAG: hypothetical protein ACM3ML_30075 [Micromonosporaceae bacterium]